MKWVIAILLTGAAALGLALLGMEDPGFVVIGRGQWTLETSFSVFLLLIALLFLFLYVALRLLSWLWQLPDRLHSGQRARRQAKTQQALGQGFALLNEAQWHSAEKQLLRGAPGPLHYAGAAYAAQQRHDLEQRDEYLSQAQEQLEDAQQVGFGLYQVQLYLRERQYHPALAQLKQLQELAPRHPQVLQQLAEVYQALGNWAQLYPLLAELRKRKALSSEELDQFEIQVIRGWLSQAAAQSAEALNSVWNRLAKTQRLEPAVLAVYGREMLAKNQHETVAELIRETLRQHWDPRLLHLYRQVEIEPGKQLAQAETWLKKHDQEPELLLLLGHLCLRNRLWGKAQQYLEAALARDDHNPETYAALGELMTQMGENAQAAQYYQQGLTLLN